MSQYFFYQTDPKRSWSIALSTERENITKEVKPALVSVLDVDNDFSRDLTLEEHLAVKYSGPFYVDFDADDEDFTVVIAQMQKFLNRLTENDVNLDSIRIYATGGRGFHVEVPLIQFIGKVPPKGIQGLPHIYKEIAYSLYVDTLDMRVYSAKKGRMWRCANVKRENGRYKVPITSTEAMEMTPDLYDEVCASPRAFPPIDPPVFNPKLGLLYSRAKDKVEEGIRRSKSKKKSSASAAKFEGEWPDSVKSIMQGKGLKDGVGWNRIAMQLALTADALGKTEEQLVADAEPLLETYQGDSSRYGSYRKRKLHLQEMFRYLAGNITYEFSVGGLIALLHPDFEAPDLTDGEYVRDPDEEDEKKEEGDDEEDQFIPIRMNRYGIFSRAEDGWKRTSSLGIGSPFQLVSDEGKVIGYDAEIFVDGKSKGRHIVPTVAFSSKAQLNNFGLAWSASVNTTDNHTSLLADLLRRRVEKKNAVTYVVHREGIDMIRPPDAKTEEDFDIVWASPHGVISRGDTRYRFNSKMDRDGAYKSDLMNAPDLQDTEGDIELVDALLNLNTPLNIGLVVGWFIACFVCQPIRYVSAGKFPPMQIFGQAEAGKSRLVGYCNRLHYYLAEPREMMSIGGTNYPALSACASSASMPVVFEELKRREMTKARADFLVGLVRSSYDGHDSERGSINRDSGRGEIVVQKHKLTGPIIFVGEALEDQTAILDRAITVALHKGHRAGRAQYDRILERRVNEIGRIGKMVAERCLALDLKKFRDHVFDTRDRVFDALPEGKDNTTRLAKSMAVPLVGLDLLKATLFPVFGKRFDEKIEELKAAILGNLASLMPNNKSEASKVLDIMAQLTRVEDVQVRLEWERDYVVTDDGHTEVNLKSAYSKYMKYMRSMGLETLYASEAAFIAGMSNYAGTVSKACPGSVLAHAPRQVIYSFNNEYLDKEEVEAFEKR